MLIAQISDTHLIVEGQGTEQRLADFRSVIADINALDPAPDVIVHTGDIAHNGTAEEYAVASEILATASAPTYVLAGNKDNRANLRSAFLAKGYLPDDTDFITYSVDDSPVRLLMLDTVNADSKKGDFCEDRFSRFADLAVHGAPKPAAVFLHHPPFEVMVGPERFHYDDLDVMKRLAMAISGLENIKGVFCGHVHRPTTGNVGRVPAVVMTSVATQLRYGDYPQEMDGKPTYLLHRFHAEFGFWTTTRIARDASSSPRT